MDFICANANFPRVMFTKLLDPSKLTQMSRGVAAAFIEHVGDFADETVIVVSGLGADFARELERLGATSVVTLGDGEQRAQERASLALVPRVHSLGWAADMLARLRQAIAVNGRIVCCVGTKCGVRPAVAFGRVLQAHGFAAIDAAHVAGHLLLSAEVPMFGPRCNA